MGEAKKCPCCGAELGECCNWEGYTCLECWFMCNGEHLDRILLAPEGVREPVVVERKWRDAALGFYRARASNSHHDLSIPSGPQPERGGE